MRTTYLYVSAFLSEEADTWSHSLLEALMCSEFFYSLPWKARMVWKLVGLILWISSRYLRQTCVMFCFELADAMPTPSLMGSQKMGRKYNDLVNMEMSKFVFND
jgi:hypothetical protein